ncbi:MAG: hypothetical protein E3K32_09875 [wastewater metagenome]|nr:hypothetical protein [Candidatus Loosdrechtia aerotolerans]
MQSIIVILGFGRSGTTWLSDVISKKMGGLILFEPFHPSVTNCSSQFAYSHISQEKDSKLLEGFLNDVLNKRHKRKWLLRNHIPVSLDEVTDDFQDTVWQECNILGFKEPRASFLISWLQKNFNAKIVFIVRHPCAVIASIKKRVNFWEEFGWSQNYKMFLQKTIFSESFHNHEIINYIDVVENARTDIEKMSVMWSITHSVAIEELERLSIPIFHYEDFYYAPFLFFRNLFAYIGYSGSNLHPSYFFTPSMTTVKTLHGLYNYEGKFVEKGASLFWENILDDSEVDTIMKIVNSFGIYIYDKTGFPVRKANKETYLNRRVKDLITH